MPSITIQNFKSVQLLRGIAALMVVLHHSIFPDLLSDYNPLKYLVIHGAKGVQVFFVISGFIIPFSMYKASYQYRKFGEFLGKRILRIEPPYVISIVLVLFLNYSNTTTAWYEGPAFVINWQNVLGHLAYINAFTGEPWLNEAYWSLAVEFEFYLFIAILFPLLNNASRYKRSLAIVAIITCSFILPNKDHHLFFQLPFFCLGMLLFLVKTHKVHPREFLISMVLVSGIIFYHFDTSFCIVGLLTTSCISLIGNAPKQMLFLGTISYSVYLVHNVIHTRFLAICERFAPSLDYSIAIVLCLSFIILLSYIFYRLFEKPFQVLSKKMFPQHHLSNPAIDKPVLAAVPNSIE